MFIGQWPTLVVDDTFTPTQRSLLMMFSWDHRGRTWCSLVLSAWDREHYNTQQRRVDVNVKYQRQATQDTKPDVSDDRQKGSHSLMISVAQSGVPGQSRLIIWAEWACGVSLCYKDEITNQVTSANLHDGDAPQVHLGVAPIAGFSPPSTMPSDVPRFRRHLQQTVGTKFPTPHRYTSIEIFPSVYHMYIRELVNASEENTCCHTHDDICRLYICIRYVGSTHALYIYTHLYVQ